MEKNDFNNHNPLSNTLKDSAIIVTIISVVLYTWGYTGELASTLYNNLPIDFGSQPTVQEFILSGGFIGLTFFLPVGVAFYLLGKFLNFICKNKIKIYIYAKLSNISPTSSVLLVLSLFLVSILLQFPISRFIAKSGDNKGFKVKNVVLNENSKINTNYSNLFFLKKRGSNYLFTNKPNEKEKILYILNENEIKELVLETNVRLQ